VSRRKLAWIETNPYAVELLSREVDVVHEPMETFGSIFDASVTHMNNVGMMLMDELAYAQTRIDSRKEEAKKLEEWRESAQDIMHGQEDSIVRQSAEIDLVKGELTTLKDLVRALVAKTGELEDDKVRGRGRMCLIYSNPTSLASPYSSCLRVDRRSPGSPKALFRTGGPS
jgi:hypothetical protein